MEGESTLEGREGTATFRTTRQRASLFSIAFCQCRCMEGFGNMLDMHGHAGMLPGACAWMSGKGTWLLDSRAWAFSLRRRQACFLGFHGRAGTREIDDGGVPIHERLYLLP